MLSLACPLLLSSFPRVPDVNLYQQSDFPLLLVQISVNLIDLPFLFTGIGAIGGSIAAVILIFESSDADLYSTFFWSTEMSLLILGILICILGTVSRSHYHY